MRSVVVHGNIEGSNYKRCFLQWIQVPNHGESRDFVKENISIKSLGTRESSCPV